MASELSETMHRARPARLLTLELNFKVDTAQTYDKTFGRGTHASSTHNKNYRCLTNLTAQLMTTVDRFIVRLEKIANLQENSYHEDVTGQEGIEKRAVTAVWAILVGLGVNIGSSIIFFLGGGKFQT